MKQKQIFLLSILLVLSMLLSSADIASVVAQQAPEVVNVPATPQQAGNDFATLVLGDAWDMNEFTDVSHYLNESGQRLINRAPSVANGIFSGTSNGDINSGQNGNFYTLFPGYETAIHTGRSGSLTPINSHTYQCLYFAIKTDSPPVGPLGPDQYVIRWFAGDKLNGGVWGYTAGRALYAANPPTPFWQVIKVNLASAQSYSTPWLGREYWEGLRIDPTVYGNVPFQVDWVRLTDCSTSEAQISFTPNSSINSVWLRPVGTNRNIRLATDVNGSSGQYRLDLQGVQAGQYIVGFGSNTTCCIAQSATPLTVNHVPTVVFDHPSFSSEIDSSTNHGVQWSFDNASEVTRVSGISSYSFSNSLLNITTNSGPLPGGNDAQFDLKLPFPLDTREYRYLSFRIFTSWNASWQNVPDGMIGRLVWSVQGSSGRQGYYCHKVSQDIPYDIGWQTITVDLHDAFDGSVEQTSGECGGLPNHWISDRPVLILRFDPNENVTVVADPITGGGQFVQSIDWIRLSKADTIKRGGMFPIRLQIEPAGDYNSLELFYTTDPHNYLQQNQLLVASSASTIQAVQDSPYKVFLPISVNNYTGGYSGLEYYWDTSTVAPGVYYICAEVHDGLNSSTTCSDVPVTVTP